MRKKTGLIFDGMNVSVLFFLILLLSLSMCKTSSQTAEQFTLTVSLSEGVSGSPNTGSNSYSQGESINYNYQPKEGYGNLIIELDGNKIASSGTITMDKNHSLSVTAGAEFTLTVSIGDGITGTPATGTQKVYSGESIAYDYQLQNGYRNLIVTLDGTQVENSGTINISSNHSLNVIAEEGYDIIGTWDLELTLSNVNTNSSILETQSVSVEFLGTVLSGSVIINGQNVGSYTVCSVVNFVYTVSDAIYGQLIYKYSGLFNTNDTLDGDINVYQNKSSSSNIDDPMATIHVKSGKWSGKRKKK